MTRIDESPCDRGSLLAAHGCPKRAQSVLVGIKLKSRQCEAVAPCGVSPHQQLGLVTLRSPCRPPPIELLGARFPVRLCGTDCCPSSSGPRNRKKWFSRSGEKKKNPLDFNHKGCWTLDCLISEGEGQLMKVEPFPSLSGCPPLSAGGRVRLIGKAHHRGASVIHSANAPGASVTHRPCAGRGGGRGKVRLILLLPFATWTNSHVRLEMPPFNYLFIHVCEIVF